MLDCLVSKPLRKQMFHQDYFDLRSLIIIKDEEALYQNLKKYLRNINNNKIAKVNIILMKHLFLNGFDTKQSNVIIISFNIIQ